MIRRCDGPNDAVPPPEDHPAHELWWEVCATDLGGCACSTNCVIESATRTPGTRCVLCEADASTVMAFTTRLGGTCVAVAACGEVCMSFVGEALADLIDDIEFHRMLAVA